MVRNKVKKMNIIIAYFGGNFSKSLLMATKLILKLGRY